MLAERRIKKTLAPITSPRTKRGLIAGRDELAGAVARLRASRDRLTPSFIIIGAQKAGTTFLYQELTRHPQVLPALTKEIHYFDDRYHRWRHAYSGFFPRVGAGGQVTGEASPGYAFHPHAARRIAHDLPEARLIMLVRDPVRRAFSQYLHEARLGYEDAPTFREALEREDARLEGEEERMLADERYVSFAWRHHSYRRRGLYLDQIRRMEDAVGADRLLVIRSEDLYDAPRVTLGRVFGFIGVDDSAPRAVGTNDMLAPAGAAIEPTETADLRASFEWPNRLLADHLGIDLGWE